MALIIWSKERRALQEYTLQDLINAIFHQNFLAVYWILCAGVNPNQYYGVRSPLLHLAVLIGNPHIIKILIFHGAALDTEDEEGFTALEKAIIFKDLTIAKILLSAHSPVRELTIELAFTYELYDDLEDLIPTSDLEQYSSPKNSF